jgi:hypothetical protein
LTNTLHQVGVFHVFPPISKANGGSDSAYELALWLGLIDAAFEGSDDPDLAVQLRELAGRYTRAVG